MSLGWKALWRYRKPRKDQSFLLRWSVKAVVCLPAVMVFNLLTERPIADHMGIPLFLSFCLAAGDHAYFLYGGTEEDYPNLPDGRG